MDRALPRPLSLSCAAAAFLVQVGQWARSLKELQNAQISLAADVRDLTHELAGHHAQDSIRSAYFAHATQIQQQRPSLSLPDHHVVALTTAQLPPGPGPARPCPFAALLPR